MYKPCFLVLLNTGYNVVPFKNPLQTVIVLKKNVDTFHPTAVPCDSHNSGVVYVPKFVNSSFCRDFDALQNGYKDSKILKGFHGFML